MYMKNFTTFYINKHYFIIILLNLNRKNKIYTMSYITDRKKEGKDSGIKK